MNLLTGLSTILSFIGIGILLGVSLGIKGKGEVFFKLLVAGIFFSVFLHAVVETFVAFGFIRERLLIPLMSVLLIVGAVFFIFAGVQGIKMNKEEE